MTPSDDPGETGHETQTVNDEDVIGRHSERIDAEGKSGRTVYDRELTLRRLARALGKPLLEATPEDLYKWRRGLKVADATVACYASNVISFYRWAVKEKLIAENPAEDLPVPPMPRRQPHPISEKDLARAIDSPARHRYTRIWLVLAAWCGLRAKEIAFLRTDCIRLGESVPHLRITHSATKGRKERIIPLHPFVIAELAKVQLSRTGLAFRSKDGKSYIPWDVSKICNDHLHGLGIADVLHSCRHRFLTRAYEVDRDLKAAQALAGHAHIQTTAGYAAIDGAALVKTVNAIPAPGEREAS